MSKKWYLKITPEELWKEFVPNSVELFISYFHYDNPPVTDIDEMCKIYSRDICNGLNRPYTEEQRKHIEGLLKKYIYEYIEKVGGYDKLKLYSREEVEAIEEQIKKDLLDTVEWYKNLSKE